MITYMINPYKYKFDILKIPFFTLRVILFPKKFNFLFIPYSNIILL